MGFNPTTQGMSVCLHFPVFMLFCVNRSIPTGQTLFHTNFHLHNWKTLKRRCLWLCWPIRATEWHGRKWAMEGEIQLIYKFYPSGYNVRNLSLIPALLKYMVIKYRDMVLVILIQNMFHVAALLKYVYIILVQIDLVYVVFNTKYVSWKILCIVLYYVYHISFHFISIYFNKAAIYKDIKYFNTTNCIITH